MPESQENASSLGGGYKVGQIQLCVDGCLGICSAQVGSKSRVGKWRTGSTFVDETALCPSHALQYASQVTIKACC